MKYTKDKYFDKNESCNIENYLLPCEEIIEKHKPNRKAYLLTQIMKILPFGVVWLLFDTLGIRFILSTGVLQEGNFIAAFVILIFAIHLTPIFIWLYHIIVALRKIKHEEYAITNERILVKEGFLSVNIKSIKYSQISSVFSDRTYTDKWVGVGDVHIVTEYREVVLHDLQNYTDITSLIHSKAVEVHEQEFYQEETTEEDNK